MNYSVYKQQQLNDQEKRESEGENTKKYMKLLDVVHKISTSTMTTKVDFVIHFPVEIRNILFENFTFRERILCTSVSKQWRFAILTYPKMWYTLTNDGSNYKLYHVMTIFQPFIQNFSIREIDYSLKVLTYERMHTAIMDLNQVMDLLEALKCSQIEKATFSYSCYSNSWFSRFQAISSTTLTSLTFVWDIYPEHTLFPTFVIKIFPNLSHFSLVLKDMGYCFRTLESLIPQIHRLLFGIDNYTAMVNDIDGNNNTFLLSPYHHSSSIYSHHQHQNLTTLHIDLSKADFILPFPEGVLKALPNLHCIKFTTHSCIGETLVKTIYESLHKYCPKIQTVSYNYVSKPLVLWTSNNNLGYEEVNFTKASYPRKMENVQYCIQFIETFFSSTKTYDSCPTSLITLELSSIYWTTDAIQHLLSSTTIYHSSLRNLQLAGGGVPQEYFAVLAKIKFLCLREITFEGPSSLTTATIDPNVIRTYTDNMMSFFVNTLPSMQYVTLKNLYIHADVLNLLVGPHKNMTPEKTLVFNYCYGVNPLDCHLPKHKFYYNDNQDHSWNLSIKTMY
ncbi:hypothetical protein BDC45DRAFT_586676 [Circinella umbellata]|nr:hypothetical protein BDC45DRAFT_586676 [Circinella umbellata]